MPRISIGRFCYNSAPFRARGLDADSTRQGKRAVRGGHAPLQAHRGEDRPAYRAARPRVLRKADRRAQTQARRRRKAPPQASAQPDAAAEALLASISLKQQITEDMKAAMRARDAARLSAIRLLLAALKQREVDERIELSDADVLSAVEKLIKQRRESIAQFEKAARNDLAAAEKFEIEVLSAYLPRQMSDAEIGEAVTAAVAESGASGMKDMAKVMAALRARLAGRADMGKDSKLVKSRLSCSKNRGQRPLSL